MTKAKNTPYIKNKDIGEQEKDFASMLIDQELSIPFYDMIKMDKQVKESLVTCSINDIRFLVDSYYQIQLFRIGLGGQIRSIEQNKSAANLHINDKKESKAEVLQWLFNNMLGMEAQIKSALDIWGDNNEVARWCKRVMGIGPVISAGLVANFDVTKAPSASHFYSYAGLNDNNDPWLGRKKAEALVKKYCPKPTVTTDQLLEMSKDPDCHRSLEKLVKYSFDEKKQKNTRAQLQSYLAKPPYNASLKVLCWKIGESFMKVSGKPESLYGRLYKERREYETAKNLNKDYAEQAADSLAKLCNKGTNTYKANSEGYLSDGHIVRRSQRYATKIFISHLFEEMYRVQYHKEPPVPYAIAYLNHVDIIEPEVPYFDISSYI